MEAVLVVVMMRALLLVAAAVVAVASGELKFRLRRPALQVDGVLESRRQYFVREAVLSLVRRRQEVDEHVVEAHEVDRNRPVRRVKREES